MDGIEAIALFIASLVEVMIALVAFTTELIVFLISLLFWCLSPKERTKPESPKWKKGAKGVKVWPSVVGLLSVVLILGGILIYDIYFKARISFSSDSPIPAWFVKYELHSDSGRKKTLQGSEEYTTFRWDSLVLTDERFEPLTVRLSKKDEIVHLKSRRIDKLKDELTEKAVQESKSLFEKAKEKLSK